MREGWNAAGFIYYAPSDPKVWVPKVRGYGWTLNFARGEAWAWLGALSAFLGLTALRIRWQN